MQKIQFVALEMSTGKIGMLQFVTQIRTSGGTLEREASDAEIQKEITKAATNPDGSLRSGHPVVSWARVEPWQVAHRERMQFSKGKLSWKGKPPTS